MATRIGQTAAELSRMNPWWRTSAWMDRDHDMREVRESGLDYQADALDGLTEGGLYLLRGPRRVGKTVVVKQTIAGLIDSGVAPRSIISVSADGWVANELRTVARHVALPPLADDQRRWWFIGEVTAATGDWAAAIKWLRDNDPDFARDTVVLTGSSASALTAASGVLAGRRGRATNADRTLMPMGFRTFLGFWSPEADQDLPRLAPDQLHTRAAAAAYEAATVWLDELVRLWEAYLNYGGFPVAVAAARTGDAVPEWFIDALFAVIHRDAFAASTLSETETTALVDRLWASMSTPLNLTTVGNDVGIGREIVRRHVAYLRDAYLSWSCPRLEHEWLPVGSAQDKIYPIDPLIGRLIHLRSSSRRDIDPTVLVESQIGMALRRAIHAAGRSWAGDLPLFYLRTPTRKEIDFVGEALGGVAVEGKYVETGRWTQEAATVNASSYRGILTTRNVLDCQSDRAWAVPAAVLAALIDT